MDSKKKIRSILKLRINAGEATASPPVGPTISQAGLNIAEFCKHFNASTNHIQSNFVLPVSVVLYTDYSYEYIIKLPTISFFLRKASLLDKGRIPLELKKKKRKFKKIGVNPREYYIGALSPLQLFEIAWLKALQLPYQASLRNVCYMICGSAHSIGIYVSQFGFQNEKIST